MKSIPVAVTAVTFMSFIIIVFLFPSSPNPTSATMNYTVVVLGKMLKEISSSLKTIFFLNSDLIIFYMVYRRNAYSCNSLFLFSKIWWSCMV